MDKKEFEKKAKQKLGIIGEFKEFISRGSVVDMAVGIIIGTAFTAIVTSLVNDVIMPAVGIMIGDIDFSDMKYVYKEAVVTNGVITAEEVAVRYGMFITKVIDFLLIALVVFLMVKAINRFKRKKEEKPAEPAKPSDEVLLLTEIRDLLKGSEDAVSKSAE